jgi:hypothetical protein
VEANKHPQRRVTPVSDLCSYRFTTTKLDNMDVDKSTPVISGVLHIRQSQVWVKTGRQKQTNMNVKG